MEIKEQITTQIPTDYTPYDQLEICSNMLIGVKKIIDDHGFIPILIGRADTNKPLIWLRTKTRDGQLELVEKNNPLLNTIAVNFYKNDNSLDIILNDRGEKYLILQMEDITDTPRVTRIDLRTLGYNIHGGEEGLMLGNKSVYKNQFQVETLVRI